jgi:selenium metabolism protein YedF
MAKTIDCRKLDCPEPVMRTRSALKESNEVVSIVDNDIAKENVCRMATSEGCDIKVETRPDGIYLTLKKGTPSPAAASAPAAPQFAGAGSVLFIGSDLIGRGENIGLGTLLMQKFLHTIINAQNRPDTVLLMNNGVKLAVADSPSLGELKELEKQGVEVLACGTCLARLELTDKIAAGKISNMDEMANKMLQAAKVISL